MKVLHKQQQNTDTVRGWEKGGQEGLGDVPSIKWRKLDWPRQAHLTPKSRLYVQHHIASIFLINTLTGPPEIPQVPTMIHLLGWAPRYNDAITVPKMQ